MNGSFQHGETKAFLPAGKNQGVGDCHQIAHFFRPDPKSIAQEYGVVLKLELILGGAQECRVFCGCGIMRICCASQEQCRITALRSQGCGDVQAGFDIFAAKESGRMKQHEIPFEKIEIANDLLHAGGQTQLLNGIDSVWNDGAVIW